MGYLEDFQTQIINRNLTKFLQLWEEYCASDTVESEEFIHLLLSIKASDFTKPFGQFVEAALPLWKTIPAGQGSYDTLKHLVDLQTTNTALLAEVSLDTLKQHYGEESLTQDRLRLTGLRSRDSFQGALSSFDLLMHMHNGNFVFHNGGWGVGEIMEVSQLREQLAIEFENVAGIKHITFANAFKTLIPIHSEHFLARRFSDADNLEKEAKSDPVKVVKLLLKDLGPKTASEIKDELCELVIPEKDWTKWWQGARGRLKKDPLVESPESPKAPFFIRKSEATHDEKIHSKIHSKTDIDDVIQGAYDVLRDSSVKSKKSDANVTIKERLLSLLQNEDLTISRALQILIILDMFFDYQVPDQSLKDIIQALNDPKEEVNGIEILAIKKRALGLIKEYRTDWPELFVSMLLSLPQTLLKDYLLKEIWQDKDARQRFEKECKRMVEHPSHSPEFLVWYFNKIVSGEAEEKFPFSDKKGTGELMEAFLTLLSQIENKSEYRDLTKKMINLLSAKRYAVIREVIDGTSTEFLKEFLLLASKCQSFSGHDLKLLRSLAAVVQPTLAEPKSREEEKHEANIIWTTEAGYLKKQARAQHIGTVEIVENAKEIEAARALGDLRENSEYKFAQEKRARLQGELRTISNDLKHARIITPTDITDGEVGIGTIVKVKNPKNETVTYTILGPWDADPDKNILSIQSKLGQDMCGLKEGDTFKFKDDTMTIASIKSFLKK